MRCKYCKYCEFKGNRITEGYYCNNPKLDESKNIYEDKNRIIIKKYPKYIGRTMIKTTLRYCPYKMMKEDSKQ